MRETLAIRTLGMLTVHLDTRPAHERLSGKAQALLVYLAYTRDTHARDMLAEFLWEGRSQSQSLTNLRKVLYQLHQMMASHLHVTHHAVGLNPHCDVALDVHAFEVEIATAALAQDSVAQIAHLTRAATLYSGDFLSGFTVNSPSFEGWALLERERLRFHAVYALDTLVELYVQRRQYDAAQDHISRLLHIDPLREKTYLDAMRLLLQVGQREAALRQYEVCQHLLRQELNIAPSPEMLALYERLQTGQDVDNLPG